MAYILGDVTLPTPTSFVRDQIETQTVNLLLNGTTKRSFVNRKEQYTLEFMHLTPSEVNQILSEYELHVVRTFQVTEDNLSIPATGVLIDIQKREYAVKGPSYRENLIIVLTEVI